MFSLLLSAAPPKERVRYLPRSKALEAKLKLISAALTGFDRAVADCWKQLRKRVADAAKARNQIAHAHAVHNGGMVKIHLGDGNTPGKATRVKLPRMELRKRKNANENVWTLERMIQEAERRSKLLEHLSAFTRRLKGGETVQPTKQEPV
jgi:hypothetical protein